jgi:hypothetical protein
VFTSGCRYSSLGSLQVRDEKSTVVPQRKSPKIEQTRKRVQLGPDALREVCDLMSFEEPFYGSDETLHVSADGWLATSTEDVLAIPQAAIRKMTIHSAQFGLTLDLDPFRSIFVGGHFSQETPKEAFAAVEKIRVILDEHTPRWGTPVIPSIVALAPMLIVTLFGYYFLTTYTDLNDYVAAVLPLAVQIGWVLAVRRVLRRLPAPPSVILKPDEWANRSFLKKYGAELGLMLTFVGVITSIVVPILVG